MVVAAAALMIVGAVVFLLLIRPGDIPAPDPPSPTAHLEERKARIYEGLRDLQFEYRLGKFSDVDYQRTKLDLQKELAVVLAAIDRLQPNTATETAAEEKPPPPANVCPHCGARFEQAMKFCGECGKKMQESA